MSLLAFLWPPPFCLPWDGSGDCSFIGFFVWIVTILFISTYFCNGSLRLLSKACCFVVIIIVQTGFDSQLTFLKMTKMINMSQTHFDMGKNRVIGGNPRQGFSL